MKISLRKKQDLEPSKWAGGETTELCIYPAGSSYKMHNFKFRLSTATIEVEESTFTFLQGIERVLMILEGCLTLNHEDHHEIVLQPFEKDYFNGSWHTKSVGKATDLNLMLSDGCKGDLEKYELLKNKYHDIPIREDEPKGIYIYKGSLTLNYLYDKKHLQQGDFVMLMGDQENEESVILSTDSGATIILAEIQLKP